jgi:hypothetical protein
VTYAGFEGESTLLEELYHRGLAQPLVAPNLRAGDGLLMFWSHDPVAPWQTPEWLAQMRRQLRPNAYLRMIENRFVSTESSFVDMDWFDACTEVSLRPVVADRGLSVWVGVDASTKRDTTAIVAVAWDAASKRVRLVAHRIFAPTAAEPLNFEACVENTVREFCGRFAVRGVYYDPYQMAATAQRLLAAGVPMKEYPQTSANLTAIGSNLYELIKGRGIVVYPDEQIRLAVSRAVAVESPRGWRIAKEKVSHKIDVVVALAMATRAAVEPNLADQWIDYMARESAAAINAPSPADDPSSTRRPPARVQLPCHPVIYQDPPPASFAERAQQGGMALTKLTYDIWARGGLVADARPGAHDVHPGLVPQAPKCAHCGQQCGNIRQTDGALSWCSLSCHQLWIRSRVEKNRARAAAERGVRR